MTAPAIFALATIIGALAYMVTVTLRDVVAANRAANGRERDATR